MPMSMSSDSSNSSTSSSDDDGNNHTATRAAQRTRHRHITQRYVRRAATAATRASSSDDMSASEQSDGDAVTYTAAAHTTTRAAPGASRVAAHTTGAKQRRTAAVCAADTATSRRTRRRVVDDATTSQTAATTRRARAVHAQDGNAHRTCDAQAVTSSSSSLSSSSSSLLLRARGVLLVMVAVLLLCALCPRDTMVHVTAYALQSLLPSSSASLLSQRHPCTCLLDDGHTRHGSSYRTASASASAAAADAATYDAPLLQALRKSLLARRVGLSGVHVRDTRALLHSASALQRAGVTVISVDEATSSAEQLQQQLRRAFVSRQRSAATGQAQCVLYIASLATVRRAGNAMKELLEDGTLRGGAALPHGARGVLVLTSDKTREALKQELPHRVVFMFRSLA